MIHPSILDGRNDRSCDAIVIHRTELCAARWKLRWERLNELFDLGHPTLNRAFNGFVKVGGVGALHAATHGIYRNWLQEQGKKKCLKNTMLKFELAEPELVLGKPWKRLVSRVGKEAVQWGFVGGVYTGVTYGMQEIRGKHDWKNALVGGAITGAAVSLTQGKTCCFMKHIIHGAITGGAVAMATGILINTALHNCD